MSNIFFPGDYTSNQMFQKLQNALDQYDEIVFNAKDSTAGGAEKQGIYHIGENTLRVKKKITIKGEAYQRMKPRIIGTAKGTLLDTQDSCGILNIQAPDVTIKDLHLRHSAPTPLVVTDGTATIACFVDNAQPWSLTVENCDINTCASAAISFQTKKGLTGTSTNAEKKSVTIRKCAIRGRKDAIGANFLGVRVGNPQGETPAVDLRNTSFEVSECGLDPRLGPGVLVSYFDSNENTTLKFLRNEIGLNRYGKLDEKLTGDMGFKFQPPAVGIMLVDPRTTPTKGSISVLNNHIVLADYWPATVLMNALVADPHWTAGVWVRANCAGYPPTLMTEITNNLIEFKHEVPPPYPLTDPWKQLSAAEWDDKTIDQKMIGGIIYEDGADSSATDALARIRENTVTSSSNAPPPLRGIWLRRKAHGVLVENNKMGALTASCAQILLDEGVHHCVIATNELGGLLELKAAKYCQKPEADLLCNGTYNESDDNRFHSQLEGWHVLSRSIKGAKKVYSAGPGCVKLGPKSTDNHVFLKPADFVGFALDISNWPHCCEDQCLDLGSGKQVVWKTFEALRLKLEERQWQLHHAVGQKPKPGPPVKRKAQRTGRS